MGRREKRKNRIKNEIRLKLDLHGYTYAESKILVEDFVLNKQFELPIDIITGNSIKMKKLVKQVLDQLEFKYIEGDFFNQGYIKIIK